MDYKLRFKLLALTATLFVGLFFASSTLHAAPKPKPADTTDATIVNDKNNPVPVSSVRKPFQTTFFSNANPTGERWKAGLDPVSDSQRLTVEFISVSFPIFEDTGIESWECFVYTQEPPTCWGDEMDIGGKVTWHTSLIATSAERSGRGGTKRAGTSQKILMFVEPETAICVICPNPGADIPDEVWSGAVSISGYLETVE